MTIDQLEWKKERKGFYQNGHPGWQRLHSLHHHPQHLGQDSQNPQPLEKPASSFASSSRDCFSGLANWITWLVRRSMQFETCMAAHFSDTTRQFQFDSLKYWWKLEFLQLGVTSFCADPEMQRTWIQMGIPLLMMHLNKNVKRMQNMFSLLCRCDYYPQSEPGFEISGTTTGGFLTLCPHQILIFHVLYLILIFPPPPVHGRVNS